MKASQFLPFFFTLFSFFLSFSHAYDFYVNGKQGWALHPSEDYNHWAGRNRFLINDNLIFKYKKGSDSVLLVNKDDYNNCNTKNPIQKMDDGNSVFKLDRAGPFYFISGEDDNCNQGEKLTVVVLHMKRGESPGANPPSNSSAAPAGSPNSHSPATKPPSGSPSGSPGTSTSPSSSAPGISPASQSPALAPGGSSLSPEANSPAGSTSGPATSPAGSEGPSSALSPPSPPGSPASATSPGGSQSSSGEVNGSPAAPKSSASMTNSSLMTLAFSIMLSLMVRRI